MLFKIASFSGLIAAFIAYLDGLSTGSDQNPFICGLLTGGVASVFCLLAMSDGRFIAISLTGGLLLALISPQFGLPPQLGLTTGSFSLLVAVAVKEQRRLASQHIQIASITQHVLFVVLQNSERGRIVWMCPDSSAEKALTGVYETLQQQGRQNDALLVFEVKNSKVVLSAPLNGIINNNRCDGKTAQWLLRAFEEC